jgi:hypothetical protein
MAFEFASAELQSTLNIYGTFSCLRVRPASCHIGAAHAKRDDDYEWPIGPRAQAQLLDYSCRRLIGPGHLVLELTTRLVTRIRSHTSRMH